MVLGRVGRNYSQLCLDDGYYHSNAKDFYKSDDQLIAELVEKILIYTKENRDAIKASYTGRIEIAYDYAAATLGKALKDELNKYKGERLIVDLIYIVPCVKFEVPTRIDIVKLLISQGRYKVNRDNLEFHFNELENAQ